MRYDHYSGRLAFKGLNTYILEIYASIRSVSYLVYKGSLQTACDNWNRNTIKQIILSVKYPEVMYFYEMKGKSDSKEMGIFRCDMIFSQQLIRDCNILLLKSVA